MSFQGSLRSTGYETVYVQFGMQHHAFYVRMATMARPLDSGGSEWLRFMHNLTTPCPPHNPHRAVLPLSEHVARPPAPGRTAPRPPRSSRAPVVPSYPSCRSPDGLRRPGLALHCKPGPSWV